jgi:hypothetical protein
MGMIRGEGDFSADLLVYAVEENKKQYAAALATIEHPGYCNHCQAIGDETVDFEAKESEHQKVLCEMRTLGMM